MRPLARRASPDRRRPAPASALLATIAAALLVACQAAPDHSPGVADLGPDTAGPATAFSDDEIARVLSHGPWPQRAPRDPTNRLSGRPAAIALGARLFVDPGLSADGRIACATCHDPARGFTDGLPRAQGLARHDRNTMGLADVALQRWFGWDGGADSLWAASLRPLLAPGEMGASPARIAARIRADAALSGAWAAATGAPLPAAGHDERVMVDAAKAIAAYLETLASPRTAFDDFRDALARGDKSGVARYPAAARRGLAIFVGRGNCHVCHFGPGFSNGEFHDVGVPFVVAPGRVDPGRSDGIRRVRSDPYNLLGRFSDEADRDAPTSRALKTRTVAPQHRNFGEWRTPTLRGLSATAPYMHDGRLATLRDVVRHYSELDEERLHADGEALLKPLRLSEREIDDLVAFLRTLDPASRPGPAGR